MELQKIFHNFVLFLAIPIRSCNFLQNFRIGWQISISALLYFVLVLAESSIKLTLKTRVFFHAVFPSVSQFMGEEDGLQIDTAICLQDPFEMSHNVCRNLHEKAAENLRRYFAAAAKIFHAMEEENEVDRPLGGLNAIFGLKVENGEKDGFWKIWDILKDEEKLLRDKFLFTIKLPLTVEFVAEFSRSQSGIATSDMETWADCAQHLITRIFREVLKFENNEALKELDKTSSDVDDIPILKADEGGKERGTKRRLSPGRKNKKIKINHGEDAEWREGGEWVMWNPVWVGRKKKSTSVEKDETMRVLKREEKISDLVLDGCMRLTQPEVSFQSNVLVWQRRPEEIHLWIGFVKISSRKKAFETMVDWLRAFLTETVSKHIRETLLTHKVEQIQ